MQEKASQNTLMDWSLQQRAIPKNQRSHKSIHFPPSLPLVHTNFEGSYEEVKVRGRKTDMAEKFLSGNLVEVVIDKTEASEIK